MAIMFFIEKKKKKKKNHPFNVYYSSVFLGYIL